MTRYLIASSAAVACALSLPAADWPQWRGPDRTGISKETGLLKTWPKDGPLTVWSVKGCGGGFSSVAIVEGTIYGTGSIRGKNVAWARKESDGSEVWSQVYSNDGSEPNSTPVVAGGKVYVLTTGGELACLDAKTGKSIWKKNFSDDFGGQMMSGWGYSETPLIDGDKLICTPGGDKAAVVALNKDTGKAIWKTAVKNAGGAGYASPIKATVGEVPMYVTLLGKSGGVVAVHADTGKLLWRYTRISNGTANIPTVVARDDLVWCSTGYGDGGSALLKMKANGKDAVSVTEVKRYRSDELQNHHGGMILVGDYVYFGNAHNAGHPACVEFKTGEIKWKENEGRGRRRRLRGGRLCRRDALLPLPEREDGTHRGDAGRAQGRGLVRRNRAEPARDVGAPGHRQRQALPSRSEQVGLLRHQGR